jgi:hypothetical protein
MDLQQKSWLSEVRMVAAGSVDGSDKRLWSPYGLSSRLSAVSYQLKTLRRFATRAGESPAPTRILQLTLPLRLAAGQLLHLWLLRSAGVVAGLERLFRFALLARGAFGFLAFFFG